MYSWKMRYLLTIVFSLSFIPGDSQSLKSKSISRNSPIVISYPEDYTGSLEMEDVERNTILEREKDHVKQGPRVPIVINTWHFERANAKGK